MTRLAVFILFVSLSILHVAHNAVQERKLERHPKGGVTSFTPINDAGEDNYDLRHQFQQLQEEMRGTQVRLLQQLQEQTDRDREQNEKITELNHRLQEQSNQIQKQNDQIQNQNDQIQNQNDQIQNQNYQILNLKAQVLELTNEKVRQDTAGTEHNVTPDSPYSHRHKRSDDTNSLEPVLSHVTSQVTQINAEIEALKNSDRQQEQARGTVYVRWGHSSCPNSSQLVYSGEVGGSWYTHSGAAVDYLCLPLNPVFEPHTIPSVNPGNNHQQLYGAEYEPREPNQDTNPACAVCRTPRASSVTVPATNTCPPGWTLDYHGYLMAGSINHAAATEFICVDSSEEYLPGTQHSDNGKLLYYTVTRCGALPCPPYVNDKIVSCVVCSK